MTRTLGYLPDPHDARDRRLRAAMPLAAQRGDLLPVSVSLWDPRVHVRDQGQTSSCVGQAWANGLQLAYLQAGADCPKLSGEFVYYLSRAEHGGEHDDSGTYLRTAGEAVRKFGAAAESTWPFSESRVNAQPNMRALHSGYDRKGLRGYYRIDSGDVDGIRQALAAGFPVVAGWQVSESFLYWKGGPVPEQIEGIVGGHALCLYGYRSDGSFEGVNSWSESWGEGGHFVATELFARQATDIWALEVRP
jgi:C1A family cysteine protease